MNRTRQVNELETIKEYVNSSLNIDISDGRRQRSYVYGRALYAPMYMAELYTTSYVKILLPIPYLILVRW